MFDKYVKVLATTARDILHERLGLKVAEPVISQGDNKEIEYPVAQVIEYQGRDNPMEGQFVLGFSKRNMALAVASILARRMGVDPPTKIDGNAIDLLSEFMNLVVGRTISAWDKMGTPVNFGPPSPLLQAKIESAEGYLTANYIISIPIGKNTADLAVSFSASGDEAVAKPRIMVVDDSKTLRAFVAGRMEAAGFEARQAADGQEAVALYQEYQPHVCLMDLVMPNLGGLEAIMAIKDQDPEARFIILTSSDRMDERVTATTLGVTEYLIKPFSEKELMGSLKRMLADAGLL